MRVNIFSWKLKENEMHLNAPAALILAFFLHQSWDHVSTESFSYWISVFVLLVNCDGLILFMLLLFLSLADWLLEWIWEICLYSGATGYQRILLCGKQNHCGHYYYGTLSKTAFKYTEPWSFCPFRFSVTVALHSGGAERFSVSLCFALTHYMLKQSITEECFNCIRVSAKAFSVPFQWPVVAVTSQYWLW